MLIANPETSIELFSFFVQSRFPRCLLSELTDFICRSTILVKSTFIGVFRNVIKKVNENSKIRRIRSISNGKMTPL